jgi:hypothetical protein
MAHTETFDPKRYTPFEKGLSPDKVLSTFPSIDTAVDHIKISAGLEKIARVMDRATLIRSYTAGDLGFILHTRHQYQWHTGYLGGIREVTAERMLKTHPERVIEWAVQGMLPKGRLGRAMFKKLKVYRGAEHPHAAQKPEPLPAVAGRRG